MRGRERGREGRGGLAPQLWSLDAPVDGDGDDDVVVDDGDIEICIELCTRSRCVQVVGVHQRLPISSPYNRAT